MPARTAGRFAIRYGLVRRALDTQAVYDGMYATSPASFWLDSNSAGDESARFSFLGDDRGPLSETLIGHGGTVSVRDRRGIRAECGDILDVLSARLAGRRIGPTCLPFEFVGGYVGYLGPKRGRVTDADLPAEAVGNPDAMWMFADRIVIVDHQASLTYLLAVEDGRTGVRIAADAWIVDTLRRMQGWPSQQPGGAEPPPPLCALDDQLSVDRMQARYRLLRRSHPAPYAALLRFGETMLLSTALSSAVRTLSSSALCTVGGRLVMPAAGGSTSLAASIPVSAVEWLQCCLPATGTGIPDESSSFGTGFDPDPRPTRLGYFGLAGGVDLSMLTPAPRSRRAAALRHSAEPLAGVGAGSRDLY